MPDSGGRTAPAKKKNTKKPIDMAAAIRRWLLQQAMAKSGSKNPADPYNWGEIAKMPQFQNQGTQQNNNAAPAPGGGGPAAAPGNPAMDQLILQLIAEKEGILGSVKEGQKNTEGFYDKYTGDATGSAEAWLKEMYPGFANLGIDTADMATDPTFVDFAKTLSTIDETNDANLATDLSWFEKMGQVRGSEFDTLVTGIKSGLIPMPGTETGGGGGGGGGRGYGRGGGGGDSEWSDTKTTEDLTGQAVDNFGANNPGYFESIMDYFSSDPEAQALVNRVFSSYGVNSKPQNILGGLQETELPALEATIEQLTAQDAANKTYMAGVPTRSIGNLPANNKLGETVDAGPMIEALINYAKAERSRKEDIVPESGSDAFNWKPEIELPKGVPPFAAHVPEGTTVTGQGQWFPKINGTNLTQPNPNYDPAIARALEAQRQGVVVAGDKNALQRAQVRSNDRDEPWDWSKWSGYSPAINPEDLEEQKWTLDVLQNMFEQTEPWDPNRRMVNTTSTMKDTANTKSTAHTYDPAAALFEPGNDYEEPLPEESTALHPSVYANRAQTNLNNFGGFGQSAPLKGGGIDLSSIAAGAMARQKFDYGAVGNAIRTLSDVLNQKAKTPGQQVSAAATIGRAKSKASKKYNPPDEVINIPPNVVGNTPTYKPKYKYKPKQSKAEVARNKKKKRTGSRNTPV
jgi:hypothetical protein